MADQIEEMVQIGKRRRKKGKLGKKNGKWGKQMKGKIRGRGEEKEWRREQNILKNYRVTVKIVNTKYGIRSLK